MTNPYRAMCAELVAAVDLLCGSGYSPAQPVSRLILTVHVEALEELAVRTRTLLAQSEPEGLSFSDVMEWSSSIEPWATWLAPGGCLENAHFELDQLVTSALARWGRPTPQPPADGEVGVLVARLRESADCCEISSWMKRDYKALTRAADLLQQQHPQPVPVAERPWEREGWLSPKGECWLLFTGSTTKAWQFKSFDPAILLDNADMYPWILPANALPTPEDKP